MQPTSLGVCTIGALLSFVLLEVSLPISAFQDAQVASCATLTSWLHDLATLPTGMCVASKKY